MDEGYEAECCYTNRDVGNRDINVAQYYMVFWLSIIWNSSESSGAIGYLLESPGYRVYKES